MEVNSTTIIKPVHPESTNGQPIFDNSPRHAGVVPTSQPLNSGTPAAVNAFLSIDKLSVAQMESLLSPYSRKRSENFAQGEINALIEEIGKHRHVLLSKCRTLRLERRLAWEEVAKALTAKHPNLIKRTGPQIKKKWENIVSKTKKKIRTGQTVRDPEAAEVHATVVRFLAATRLEQGATVPPLPDEEMKDQAVATVITTAVSLEEQQTTATGASQAAGANNGTVNVQPQPVIKNEVEESKPISVSDSVTTREDSGDEDSENESSESSHDETSLNTNWPGNDTIDATPNPTQRGRGEKVETELLKHAREEHELRMEVLRTKHYYWQLKVESLLQRSTNTQRNGVSPS